MCCTVTLSSALFFSVLRNISLGCLFHRKLCGGKQILYLPQNATLKVFFPRAVMVASKQAKHKCKFNVNAWLQCKKGISYSAIFKGALHPKIKLHIFPSFLPCFCACELPNSEDIGLKDVCVIKLT